MSAPTPPWEAEAIEAFAVGSTRDFDRNPAVWQTSMPPKVESRALGATSLVLALFPVAFVFVFYLIGMIVSFQPDAGFLAGIGQIIIGFIGGGVSALICFPIAIVTGIMAIRGRRGSGLGIGGITVVGVVVLLFGGNIVSGLLAGAALQ